MKSIGNRIVNGLTRPSTRTIRAIVTSISLVAIVALGIPNVDEYFRLRRDEADFIELEAELADAEQRQSQVERVGTRLTADLQQILNRSTPPDSVEAVREQIIEIVRRSGGRLRNLEISEPDSRTWTLDDDPRRESTPLYGEPSGFVLHRHHVELHADGSLGAMRKVIGELNQRRYLMLTRELTLQPTTQSQSAVKLEWQITLLGMTTETIQTGSDDDFAAGRSSLRR